jgi:exopolysaccharide biosynthesis polyprenyl glycosylphosphotransferase
MVRRERDLPEQLEESHFDWGRGDLSLIESAPGLEAKPLAEIGLFDRSVRFEASVAARRDSLRRRLLALADVLGLVLADAVVWLIAPPHARLSDRIVLAAALPFWVILNKLLGLYDRDAVVINHTTLDELPRLGYSITAGTALSFLLTPTLAGFQLGRAQTAVFALAALITLPGARAAARIAVRRITRAERIAIIGSGSVARLVAAKLMAHPEYGTELVGFIDERWDDPDTEIAAQLPRPVLGTLAEYEDACRDNEVERVVIAFSALSHERLLDLTRISQRLSIKVSLVPRLFEAFGHSVEVDQIEGMSLLGLSGFQRTRSTLAMKRAMDFVGASVALLVLLPLLIVIAAAVKLTSRGPILYVQERVGRKNRSFEMFKFRTMVRDAEALKEQLAHLNEAVSPMFKIADDPRITPIGRFLRKTSLDELPQLINVLRGEMSLVGPRPLIPAEDGHVLGWHRMRLSLTPGLTGPWQVMGRTAIPFQEMVKLDYLYVAEWSIWNDVKILLRTGLVVLRARGS